MNPCLARRHNLPLCSGKLAPIGRTQLRMLDEGVCELLVFTCTECMRIHLERPTVTTLEIVTNENEFWKHQDTCNICSQHPQSVASFHYETMCPIGRSYTEKQGYFKNYGPPAISGPKIYIQDIAGCSQDYLKQFKEINEQ